MAKFNYVHEGKKFYVEGSEKIEFPEIKRVVYVSHENRVMIIWEGNRKTPVSNYVYREQDFKEAVDREIEWSKHRVQEIYDYEAARAEEVKDILATAAIGDVYVCSWGHGQTNIDFYQVVAMKGKKFSFKKICSEITEYNDRSMSGKKIPLVDEFYSDEVLEKTLTKDAVFKKSSFESLKRAEYELDENGERQYKARYYSDCY